MELELLTPDQFREALAKRGITGQGGAAPSRNAVYAWCSRGLVQGATRLGRIWMIPRAAVDTFVPPRRGRKPLPSPSPLARAQRESRARRATKR